MSSYSFVSSRNTSQALKVRQSLPCIHFRILRKNMGIQRMWDDFWKSFTISNISDWLEEKKELYAIYDRLIAGDVLGKQCLEIGGGTGRLSLYLARKGAYPTIIDSSPHVIPLQRQLFDHYQVPCHSIVHDFTDYPFSQRFDVIHAEHILDYFNRKDRIEIVEQLCSLLKPGGQLVIVASNRQNPFYRLNTMIDCCKGGAPSSAWSYPEPSELACLFTNAGLSDIREAGANLLTSWTMLVSNVVRRRRIQSRFSKWVRKMGITDMSTGPRYTRLAEVTVVVGTKPDYAALLPLSSQ